MSKRAARRAVLISVAACLAWALMPATAQATEWDVTRFDDPAPGACNSGVDCSLREAVISANANNGDDVIILSPGTTYKLSIPGSGEANEGDLDMSGDVSIGVAGGVGTAIIDANGSVTGDRGLEIVLGTTNLNNVEVNDGAAPLDGDNIRRGGGIRVDAGATLNMFRGGLHSNSTADDANTNHGEGGGLYNESTANFDQVAIGNNHVDFGFGGGTYTPGSGTTNLTDSAVRGNLASFGGGVAGPSVTHFTRSFLFFNQAEFGGGAYVNGPGAVILTNTTAFDNLATDRGGAARVLNGTLSISSSTITGNFAPDGGGIAAQQSPSFSAAVLLFGTILGGNTDTDLSDGGNHPDCADATGNLFGSNGYNIVQNNTGCDLHPVTGDQIGTSLPQSQPVLNLADPLYNGARYIGVATAALEPGSAAINKSSPDSCPDTDARGMPRNLGGRCDVGAYELVKCAGVAVNRFVKGSAGNDTIGPLITPTPGDDGVLGSTGDNLLRGRMGNDAICGRGGADTLKGDSGKDHLKGGRGGDTLKGGSGDDVLEGGPGSDHLEGGTGHDICFGGPATDTATGCEVKHGIP